MSDPYTIEHSPTPPKLPGALVLRPEPEDVLDALAADFLIHAHNCVRQFGSFQVALSGGSTPLPFYQRLMIDPHYRDLPWSKAHVWIVDERRVGFDDDRSNFKAISEIIGDHSGLPKEQLHPILALEDDCDVQYSKALREVLGWRERGHDRLDFVLLGMGSDAHTASLFPHSPALRESLGLGSGREAASAGNGRPHAPGDVPLVRINAGPSVTPPDRVTMMLPFLNASRFIAVLVTGSGKRLALAKIAERAPDRARSSVVEELPILGLSPMAGELRWYLDHAACPESNL